MEDSIKITINVLAGLGMMITAAIWFIVGYSAGYIYIYPPFLFIAGLYGMIRGIFKAVAAKKR